MTDDEADRLHAEASAIIAKRFPECARVRSLSMPVPRMGRVISVFGGVVTILWDGYVVCGRYLGSELAVISDV